jgi:hypothetical protein
MRAAHLHVPLLVTNARHSASQNSSARRSLLAALAAAPLIRLLPSTGDAADQLEGRRKPASVRQLLA